MLKRTRKYWLFPSLEEVALPPQADARVETPGLRDARFSKSWSTNRWVGGEPEEAQVYSVGFQNTPWLAYSRTTRRPGGRHRKTQLEAPGRVEQCCPSLFYNLTDHTQVEALTTTLRTLVAFYHDGEELVRRGLVELPLVDEKDRPSSHGVVLCTSTINSSSFVAVEGDLGTPDLVEEQVVAYRAWDIGKNRERWLLNIERWGRWSAERGSFRHPVCNIEGSASSYRISFDTIPVLAQNTLELFVYVADYAENHPEQRRTPYQRYNDERANLALFWPKQSYVDDFLLPRLHYATAAKSELGLWTYPELTATTSFKRRRPLLGRCKALPVSLRLDPSYVARLHLWINGELSWHPRWSVSHQKAHEDWSALLAETARCVWLLYPLLLCLRARPRVKPATPRQPRLEAPARLEPQWQPCRSSTARAPPLNTS